MTAAPAPVTLPRLQWGDPSSARHALLVHGLGSSGALMWRFGVALADAGWSATAVDLRGHGDAPRALDYRIAAYAADMAGVRPDGGGPWDLVVGHSLGGAASTAAASADPAWTRRLVLVDPAIFVDEHDSNVVRRSQDRAFADNRIEVVREEHPHWHPHDLELKVDAVARASRWAVEQTSIQNATTWDVRDAAARLTVPTHILGADPDVYSLFTGELADEVLRNPAIAMSIVRDAGHSPHRDKPEQTLRQFFEVIA